MMKSAISNAAPSVRTLFFFFNDTATTEIYTLSLHDALPIAIADHAALADPLVLAAMALPVLHRTEDALAEQPVPLRLEGAVVDGLRLRHFAPRPPGPLALQPAALTRLRGARGPELLWCGGP